MRRLFCAFFALLAVIGCDNGGSKVLFDVTAPTLSAGSADRTSSTEAIVKFTTDEAGTAYYLVVNAGAAAPTKAQVKATGETGAAGLGANSTRITFTNVAASAADCYVVVEDLDGNISEPLKIIMAAWDTTPPTLSAGSVTRANDTAATVGFTTNEAGTAYYIVADANAATPTGAQVKAGTSLGAVSGTVTGKAVKLTAGAKDIYVAVEDAAGNISTALKIAAVEYSVAFDANGGSGTMPATRKVYPALSITLPNGDGLTRSGYAFVGWNTDSTGTGTGYSADTAYVPTGNVTLYARWTPTYTITFDANGGDPVNPATSTTGVGGKLSALPTPTRPGYDFNHWFTAATEGDIVTEDKVYTANTTIYARWTLRKYTITFDAAGGSVNPASGLTGEGWMLVGDLPTPTRTGYTFNGWFTAAEGGTAVGEDKVFTADVRIFAQWTPVTYNITYNLNDGNVSPPNPPTYNIETQTFTLTNPTKTDYAFTGWTGTNGSTPQKAVTIAKGSTDDKTYTANWVPTYTDPRDGKTYRMVAMDTQMWMAENLNYAASGSKCYSNNEDNCTKYGRLYNWSAAIVACPAGLHLPTDAEWNVLMNYIGGDAAAGTKLKSPSYWQSYSAISTPTDNYGFSALPGGNGLVGGGYYDVGERGYWWNATQGNESGNQTDDIALGWQMRYDIEFAIWFSSDKTNLYSVRCVRD